MTATSLMLSILFSTFGLGFLMYAKNAGKFLPGIVGGILMVIPYFVSSNLLLVVVCLPLTALPFVFRDL